MSNCERGGKVEEDGKKCGCYCGGSWGDCVKGRPRGGGMYVEKWKTHMRDLLAPQTRLSTPPAPRESSGRWQFLRPLTCKEVTIFLSCSLGRLLQGCRICSQDLSLCTYLLLGIFMCPHDDLLSVNVWINSVGIHKEMLSYNVWFLAKSALILHSNTCTAALKCHLSSIPPLSMLASIYSSSPSWPSSANCFCSY